ncbi:MAG: tetratricopeptide repeat protein [Aureliella sp.]
MPPFLYDHEARRRTGWASVSKEFLLFTSLLCQLCYCGSHQSRVCASDLDDARNTFYAGDYSDCIKLTREQVDKGIWNDFWAKQLIRCLLTTGQYDEAKQVYESVAEKFGTRSIPLRVLACEAYRYSGDARMANQLLDQIPELVENAPWRYSDRENLLAVGRYLLEEGEDARYILESCFDRILKSDPKYVDAHIAIAELALDKSDFQEAVTSLGKAQSLRDNDPYIAYLLAKAWAPSDPSKATTYLQAALDLNPRHIPSLLLNAEELIDAERYADAEESISAALKVNKHCPEAWALRAAIAHFQGEYAKEGEYRSRGLAQWDTNPIVDYKIGQLLSKHYRFSEGVTYQERALKLDSGFRPARFQLAQDLLRVGKDQEGWELVAEVADADRYNVVAYNLKTLRENLSKFTTLETDEFILRMDALEAEVYGPLVLELLTEAHQTLCKKYDVELERKTTVEIFPKQRDFAIRTFGLPGGDGFLGVCFGSLITANSPASQGESPSNWASVLWHEFCHVVTLQKTQNRMPRWLSEGISVYEEIERDSSWGESINPQYKAMLLGDAYTPLSELSSAFLSPPSGLHLQFAYYESSLAVKYLIEKHGHATLLKLLDDLGMGVGMNEALSRRVGDLAALDDDFHSYVKEVAFSFNPETDFSQEGLPRKASADAIAEWSTKNPNNYFGRLLLTQKFLEAGKLNEAAVSVRRLIELYPEDTSPSGSLDLAIRVARKQGDRDSEREYLDQVLTHASDNLTALRRLIVMDTEDENYGLLATHAHKLLAVNPLLKEGHEAAVLANLALGHDDVAIPSLKALLELEPLDPAEIHFQLAGAYFKSDQLDQARRECLYALEFAPRYRDAHKLLVKIVAKRDKVLAQNSETETGFELPGLSPAADSPAAVDPAIDAPEETPPKANATEEAAGSQVLENSEPASKASNSKEESR